METWGLELRSSVLPEGAWRVLPLWGSIRAGFRFANPSLERQAQASGWGAPALCSVLTFTRAQAPTKGLLKCKYVDPSAPGQIWRLEPCPGICIVKRAQMLCCRWASDHTAEIPACVAPSAT